MAGYVNEMHQFRITLLALLFASAASAQDADEGPKRIEFDQFLVIAGEDIAREFASCAGYYAVWAASVEQQGHTENAAELRAITQYAVDTATEAARGVRDAGEVDEFVRGYVLDTASSINRMLSAPGAEWSTVYEVYDEACRWALDNQDEAMEQWTARTAARLTEQGYELGQPPPESDQ